MDLSWVILTITAKAKLAHSCTRFPCYLGMEINVKTQWTTTKIVELGN